MKKNLLLIVAAGLAVFPGCLNTRILNGGVNGLGAAASVGPVLVGAFVGKAYMTGIDADLATGEGVYIEDKHGFAGAAAITGAQGNADGDASGQMDREFKAEIYQAEGAKITPAPEEPEPTE